MSNLLYKIDKSFFNEDNISKNILPYFNIYDAEISLVKFKDTDKQRAVYKVKFNNKLYCLKKIYFSKEELLYVYSALEWLHIYNINVPNLLSTANGMRYLDYNNIFFILTPWIEGVKCNFDNIYHIKKSASELAKFHNCTKNFTPIKGSFLREGYDDLYKSIYKHFNQLLEFSNSAFKKKDSFSKKYIEYFDINLDLCKLALQHSLEIDAESLSKSLCHGDYVNKNIIFSKEDLWIIDFDKCKNDFCAHDLSYFMRRLLKRENTNWDTDLTLIILTNYNYHKKLTKSDLKYIIAYLAFPQKFWKVSHDYYKNSKVYSKTYFSKILLKANTDRYKHLNFIIELTKRLDSINWDLDLLKNKTL